MKKKNKQRRNKSGVGRRMTNNANPMFTHAAWVSNKPICIFFPIFAGSGVIKVI